MLCGDGFSKVDGSSVGRSSDDEPRHGAMGAMGHEPPVLYLAAPLIVVLVDKGEAVCGALVLRLCLTLSVKCDRVPRVVVSQVVSGQQQA
ncbi:hypothetical protein KUF71_022789 [Frankliniella fusca]|uniref:Uncharacterized protein n=1 Tax=Frankliniella fusca TaxID=407009 RepID=A0AAE1H490_9NEOP|nr:hypothetical protein KUF71_022789 [Frankliniella fusca]